MPDNNSKKILSEMSSEMLKEGIAKANVLTPTQLVNEDILDKLKTEAVKQAAMREVQQKLGRNIKKHSGPRKKTPGSAASEPETVPALDIVAVTPAGEMALMERFSVEIKATSHDDPAAEVVLDLFSISVKYNPDVLVYGMISLGGFFKRKNLRQLPTVNVKKPEPGLLEIEVKSNGVPFSVNGNMLFLQFQVVKAAQYPTLIELGLIGIGRNVNGSLIKAPAYLTRGLVNLQKGQVLEIAAVGSDSKTRLAATAPVSIKVSPRGKPGQAVELDVFSISLDYDPNTLRYDSFSVIPDFLRRNAAHTPTVTVKKTEANRLVITAASNGGSFTVADSIVCLFFVVLNASGGSSTVKPQPIRVGKTIDGTECLFDTAVTNGTVLIQASKGVGPSGNNISMESVGSIEQSYIADRIAPTASITGRGYNLLTSHIWSAKDMPVGAIIDFTGLHGAISQTLVGSQDFTVVTESSASRLSKKFSEKCSFSCGFGLFKASMSQSYEKNTNVSEDKAYSKIWYEYIGMREEITTGEWKRHLNPSFWNDLNNSAVSPETLFQRYGTHLILRGLYGGHMDLLGVTEKKVKDTTTKIEASLSASIGSKAASAAKANGMSIDDILAACARFGITPNVNLTPGSGTQQGGQQQSGDKGGDKSLASLNFETSYEESSSYSADKLNLEGHIVGGYGNIPKTLAEFTGVANSWIGTLKEQASWRFCGVPKGSDSLYPIWELLDASDPRRRQLSDYFDAELLKNQSALIDQESYVTDIKLVWAKNKNEALIKAANYERLGYKFDTEHDLNDGVKGAGYLYIGYLRQTKAQIRASGSRPITNLFIYCDNKTGWQYKRFENWRQVHGGEVKLDGIYLNGKFNHVGWYWYSEDSYTADREISNLSHGKVGDGNFMLLCYTNSNNFTPLTALGVYYDDDEFEAYHESKEWIDVPERGPYTMTGDRCSTTYGSGGTSTYIVFKRSDEPFSL